MRQSPIIAWLICFELVRYRRRAACSGRPLAWLNISRRFATIAAIHLLLLPCQVELPCALSSKKKKLLPNTWLENSGELLVMARRRDIGELLAVTHGGVPVTVREPKAHTPARAPASVV
jgi:hypothetical protein